MHLLTAAEASTSSLLTYLLVFALIFSFGYARAVWVRARKDYKSTKAAVKPLRKAMWLSILNAFKLGVFVVLVAVVLVAWVVADNDENPPRQETPAKVTSPDPARSR